MNKRKTVFHISLFFFAIARTAHGQLLLDRFVTENPAGTVNWTRAGVTEDLSKAVIGAIGNAANAPVIYNLLPGLTAVEDGAENTARPNQANAGGIRFAGNPMLNSYVWFRGGHYTMTIEGFVDALGKPVTIRNAGYAPYQDVQGNSFTIQAKQAYRLYLFGVGYRDGEHSAFTFNGVTKESNPPGKVVDSEENLHFVVFDFMTPEDLSGWKLTFTAKGVGLTGAFNGLALVPAGP